MDYCQNVNYQWLLPHLSCCRVSHNQKLQSEKQSTAHCGLPCMTAGLLWQLAPCPPLPPGQCHVGGQKL